MLDELRDDDLSVKDVAGLDKVLDVAEDETLVGLVLVDTLDANLEVVAGARLLDLLLVADDALDLDDLVVGHHAEEVADGEEARLELAVDDGALVPVLVDDREPHGAVGVALDEGEGVEGADERVAAVQQLPPVFGNVVEDLRLVAEAAGLSPRDLHPDWKPQVPVESPA